MPYYAIAKGRKTGIYEDWNEAKRLVIGYNGAKFKKFDTLADAQAFVNGGNNDPSVHETHDKEPDGFLIAFCDGACSGNGRKNAKGGYSSIWPFHEEHNGGWILSCENPTNNKAEFMGLIKSFEIADIIDPEKSKTLQVYTDSMFLINCITKWLSNWKKNGFKKSDGSDVLNQDLLMIIDECQSKRQLELIHVRAHTGGTDWKSRWNAIADAYAQKARE